MAQLSGPYVLITPSPFATQGIEINRPNGAGQTRLFWVKVGDTSDWATRLGGYQTGNPDFGHAHCANVTFGNDGVGKWIEDRLFKGYPPGGGGRAVFPSAHAGVAQTSEWHAVYGPALADMQNLINTWAARNWTGGVGPSQAELAAIYLLIPVACANPNN